MRWFPGRKLGRVILAVGIALLAAQSGSAMSLSGLVISEVLANPLGFDANQDGDFHLGDDEYVELFNGTGMLVDLGGFSISDSSGVRHVFAANTIIADGEYIVVFGGGDVSGFPGTGVLATTGTLAITNSGDRMFLRDAAAILVDLFVYESGLTGESRVRHDGQVLRHTDVAPEVGSPGFATLATPEPAAALLLGSGLLGLGLLGRRRN